VLETRDITIRFGGHVAVDHVSCRFAPGTLTSIVGPNGAGKTTYFNLISGQLPASDGTVLLDGEDIYSADVDPVNVRRTIGMVFQRPNPFPTMSIKDNVLAGLTLDGRKRSKSDLASVVEKSLRGANLWDEVKDRLDRPGAGLSGGQQQRLCIARAIAVEPQVLLMDEPCSALDPISTLAIEDLIEELKEQFTIVIVTHNMQQAARVSDTTAFFNLSGVGKPGKLVEIAATPVMFSTPTQQATEDYISGRFG